MSPRTLAFVWDQFGPYHADRLNALARALPPDVALIGCQIAAQSRAYAWAPTDPPTTWRCITLYAGRPFEDTRWIGRLIRLRRSLPHRATLFLAGYHRLDIGLLALVHRLGGGRVYLMNDSKLDDKPRMGWRERGKALACAPYDGALTGGPRHIAYLRSLGFRRRPVVTGYDAVDLERVVSDWPTAPDGPAFAERHFLAIARLVPKKNLSFLLRAYARYAAAGGGSARRLVLVGDGPLRGALEREAAVLGIAGRVEFRGFLQAPAVGEALSTALALLLPSREEQWGLVVNEALAFNLPVVVSSQVGAHDALVRDGESGFVLEADDLHGWAEALQRLDTNEALWRRLAEGARLLRPEADVARFVAGVRRLADV